MTERENAHVKLRVCVCVKMFETINGRQAESARPRELKSSTTFNRIQYTFIFGSLVILKITETERERERGSTHVLLRVCVCVKMFETVKGG